MVKFELKRLTLVRLHLHDACATESWKMGSSLYERIPQEAARGHVQFTHSNLKWHYAWYHLVAHWYKLTCLGASVSMRSSRSGASGQGRALYGHERSRLVQSRVFRYSRDRTSSRLLYHLHCN